MSHGPNNPYKEQCGCPDCMPEEASMTDRDRELWIKAQEQIREKGINLARRYQMAVASMNRSGVEVAQAIEHELRVLPFDPLPAGDASLTKHSCDSELERVFPGHSQADDGEIWTCSCGKKYQHLCDEAEGCSWQLVKDAGEGQEVKK